MKVKELIAELQEMPQDSEVCTKTFNDEYDEYWAYSVDTVDISEDNEVILG